MPSSSRVIASLWLFLAFIILSFNWSCNALGALAYNAIIAPIVFSSIPYLYDNLDLASFCLKSNNSAEANKDWNTLSKLSCKCFLSSLELKVRYFSICSLIFSLISEEAVLAYPFSLNLKLSLTFFISTNLPAS